MIDLTGPQPNRPTMTDCPACRHQDFIEAEGRCDRCFYRPTCITCGDPIDPRDHSADHPEACSWACWRAIR